MRIGPSALHEMVITRGSPGCCNLGCGLVRHRNPARLPYATVAGSAAILTVAAEVRRRPICGHFRPNPLPYLGGYGFQTGALVPRGVTRSNWKSRPDI